MHKAVTSAQLPPRDARNFRPTLVGRRRYNYAISSTLYITQLCTKICTLKNTVIYTYYAPNSVGEQLGSNHQFTLQSRPSPEDPEIPVQHWQFRGAPRKSDIFFVCAIQQVGTKISAALIYHAIQQVGARISAALIYYDIHQVGGRSVQHIVQFENFYLCKITPPPYPAPPNPPIVSAQKCLQIDLLKIRLAPTLYL